MKLKANFKGNIYYPEKKNITGFAGDVYGTDGLAPTLTTMQGGGREPTIIQGRNNMSDYAIRKLTPRECGRLMGVNDNDITKMLEVNSNSQCYKQYGNSIVVEVLCAIFSQMHIKGVEPWNEKQSQKKREYAEWEQMELFT